MIVINLSGSEQNVDLSEFDTFEMANLHVVTSAPNSRFDAGYDLTHLLFIVVLINLLIYDFINSEIVEKNNVTLGLYDAVVFDYVSSGSGVVFSITLLLSSILIYFLN